jgi:TetR/AcrR family transcriptional regulator, mexJK operon transcriptional repressor
MTYMRALPPRASGGFDSHGRADGPDIIDEDADLAEALATKSAQRSGAPAVRSQTKEEEVLDIAAEYFLTHGYEGTSINAMARDSGISKESIYRYFNSKRHLFEAVIERELSQYKVRLQRLDKTLKVMETRRALVTMAETLLGIITTDRTLAMRRLIFREVSRSPYIGQHYWEIGPTRAYRNLEKLFGEYAGEMKMDFEPKVLSQYFVALLTHKIMLERACGVREAPTQEQIKEVSRVVVDDFLKAFLRS